MGSAECNGFAVGLRAWHLDKDSSLGQNLIDGVTSGSDDVLMLRLLHLDEDSGRFLVLKSNKSL